MRFFFGLWVGCALRPTPTDVPTKTGGSGALPFTKIEKYKSVTFTGRRWSWIDPKAEVDANAVAIGQRLKSRSEVIREMGGDPDDVWAEIEREDKALEALGIVPDLMPGAQKPEPTTQDAGGATA